MSDVCNLFAQFHNAEVYDNRVNMKSARLLRIFVGESMTKQCRYNMIICLHKYACNHAYTDAHTHLNTHLYYNLP